VEIWSLLAIVTAAAADVRFCSFRAVRGPDRICSWSPYQTGRDLMAKLLSIAQRRPRFRRAPGHRLPCAGRHAGHPTEGASPFAGYQVTAYTNDEEDAVGLREKPGGPSRTNRSRWASSFPRRDLEALHGRGPQSVHRPEPRVSRTLGRANPECTLVPNKFAPGLTVRDNEGRIDSKSPAPQMTS
jgi:hypothetical protein